MMNVYRKIIFPRNFLKHNVEKERKVESKCKIVSKRECVFMSVCVCKCLCMCAFVFVCVCACKTVSEKE